MRLIALVLSCAALVSAAAEKAEPLTEEQVKMLWSDLADGNKRFVDGACQPRAVVDQRKALASGQKPKFIVLACADSRVSPELVFDKTLGELFVVRIAGNIADKTALGSIEYAVEHLESKMIVVLGHEKCGAVAAAASGEEMPSNNLKELVKKIRPALKNVPADADDLALAQVRANVKQSAADILKNSEILKKAAEHKKISIVPAVYKLESGSVEKLE